MPMPSPDPAALKRLRQSYKERLKGVLQKIELFQAQLREGALAPALSDELKSLAHSMAGTGGTFGYPDISSFGRELDKYIAAGGEDLSKISDLLRNLSSACTSAMENGDEEGAKSLVTEKDENAGEKKPFILVVDDDKEIADFLHIHFSARGIDIETAQDGDVAVKTLSTLSPDLIVLDIMMPKMNGHQVLAFIKGNNALKDIPVIMLTSQQENTNITQALSRGAIDYIVKPFKAEQLIHKAESLLAAARKTILIIEKDPLITEFISYIYTDKGYNVITATNGIEGWKVLQQKAPDLVILDWLLPNMDAIDILKNIHSHEKTEKIPVIVLADEDENESTTGYPGISQLIKKPFIPRDLLKRSLALMN